MKKKFLSGLVGLLALATMTACGETTSSVAPIAASVELKSIYDIIKGIWCIWTMRQHRLCCQRCLMLCMARKRVSLRMHRLYILLDT